MKKAQRRPLISFTGDLQRWMATHTAVLRCHCSHMLTGMFLRESVDDFQPPELDTKRQSNWHAVVERSRESGLPIRHINKMH